MKRQLTQSSSSRRPAALALAVALQFALALPTLAQSRAATPPAGAAATPAAAVAAPSPPEAPALPSEAQLAAWEARFKPGRYQVWRAELGEDGKPVESTVTKNEQCLKAGGEQGSGLGHFARFPGWEMTLRKCQLVKLTFSNEEYAAFGLCPQTGATPVVFLSGISLKAGGQGFEQMQGRMIQESGRAKLLQGVTSNYTYLGGCVAGQGLDEVEVPAKVMQSARAAIEAAPVWAPKFKKVTFGYSWKEGEESGESLNVVALPRQGLVYSMTPVAPESQYEGLAVGSFMVKSRMSSSLPVGKTMVVKELSLTLAKNLAAGQITRATLTAVSAGDEEKLAMTCTLGAPIQAKTIFPTLTGRAFPHVCIADTPDMAPDESLFLEDIGLFIQVSAAELFSATSPRRAKMVQLQVEK